MSTLLSKQVKEVSNAERALAGEMEEDMTEANQVLVEVRDLCQSTHSCFTVAHVLCFCSVR